MIDLLMRPNINAALVRGAELQRRSEDSAKSSAKRDKDKADLKKQKSVVFHFLRLNDNTSWLMTIIWQLEGTMQWKKQRIKQRKLRKGKEELKNRKWIFRNFML